MKYREIVSVTGMGGLFQLLTTKSDGAIVRNVADKSTRFISARQHNVTPLESIEVYTTGDNVRLHEVFKKMQEHEADIPLVDAKIADNNGIKSYFKSIFPEFDEERVYVSDMKKMLKWYELLKATDLLHFEEEAAETEESAAVEETFGVVPVTEETPVDHAGKTGEATSPATQDAAKELPDLPEAQQPEAESTDPVTPAAGNDSNPDPVTTDSSGAADKPRKPAKKKSTAADNEEKPA